MQGLVAGNVAALVAPQPLYLPDLTGRQADLPSPLQLMPEQSTIAADRLETLRIENLGYHYPQSDRGIETISFTLHRGSLTVITGEMGAGKTTLLRTVLGLLPSESGQVFWNGVAIPDPAHFWIPPRSAYTPQVPQLLSTTLRENVLLGLTNSDEQVMQALGLACFDRDLLQMPEGLNTLVGSQGMRLSGGQIQRLAVARMLLRQPELLVFDDVSSALDWETEQALWARLLQPDRLNLTWQPTCLVVSHRRSVLEKADQVLVLRQGRITQMGRFHDLQIV
jgi:ATP-binding cassette, subfamily B, bacterial